MYKKISLLLSRWYKLKILEEFSIDLQVFGQIVVFKRIWQLGSILKNL